MNGVRGSGSSGLTTRSGRSTFPILAKRTVSRKPAAHRADPADGPLHAEIAALRREQKELRDALFEAVQVHRKLCAPREVRRGSFEIAGEMFAVRHLSGDFLKVLDLGSRTGLALGDIAGKGISAGLWVAHLIGLIRIYATEHDGLPAALESINRELCNVRQSGPEPPMVALFLARLDPHTGELEYCNAGQPAALLLRRRSRSVAPDSPGVESLHEGGPMLGAVREATFTCGRVRLERGDTLVTYSDGVVESRGRGGEEFGAGRLGEAIRATNGSSANQTLFSTLGAVLDFAGGRPLEDDLTLMVVRHRP